MNRIELEALAQRITEHNRKVKRGTAYACVEVTFQPIITLAFDPGEEVTWEHLAEALYDNALEVIQMVPNDEALDDATIVELMHDES